MEQLIAEIEAYAAKAGVEPTTIIRKVIIYNSKVWPGWVDGTRVCSVPTAQKIRDYMAANPLE